MDELKVGEPTEARIESTALDGFVGFAMFLPYYGDTKDVPFFYFYEYLSNASNTWQTLIFAPITIDTPTDNMSTITIFIPKIFEDEDQFIIMFMYINLLDPDYSIVIKTIIVEQGDGYNLAKSEGSDDGFIPGSTMMISILALIVVSTFRKRNKDSQGTGLKTYPQQE